MMLATDLKLALCDVAGIVPSTVKLKFELYFSKSANGRPRNAASCRVQLRLMGRLIRVKLETHDFIICSDLA